MSVVGYHNSHHVNPLSQLAMIAHNMYMVPYETAMAIVTAAFSERYNEMITWTNEQFVSYARQVAMRFLRQYAGRIAQSLYDSVAQRIGDWNIVRKGRDRVHDPVKVEDEPLPKRSAHETGPGLRSVRAVRTMNARNSAVNNFVSSFGDGPGAPPGRGKKKMSKKGGKSTGRQKKLLKMVKKAIRNSSRRLSLRINPWMTVINETVAKVGPGITNGWVWNSITTLPITTSMIYAALNKTPGAQSAGSGKATSGTYVATQKYEIRCYVGYQITNQSAFSVLMEYWYVKPKVGGNITYASPWAALTDVSSSSFAYDEATIATTQDTDTAGWQRYDRDNYDLRKLRGFTDCYHVSKKYTRMVYGGESLRFSLKSRGKVCFENVRTPADNPDQGGKYTRYFMFRIRGAQLLSNTGTTDYGYGAPLFVMKCNEITKMRVEQVNNLVNATTWLGDNPLTAGLTLKDIDPATGTVETVTTTN